jgi:hypothetical protein
MRGKGFVAHCRFVVLVSGTLVYSKGDAAQAEAEAAELGAGAASFEAAPVPEMAPVLGGARQTPPAAPHAIAWRELHQHHHSSNVLLHGLGCARA